MARSISDPANITRISLVIAILCLMISLKGRDNQIKVELRFVENELPRPLLSTTVSTSSSSWDLHPSTFLSMEDGGEDGGFQLRSLEYDFYRDSCPQAEKVIREMVQEMYDADPSVSAALLRLAFHDCFIEVTISLSFPFVYRIELDSFPVVYSGFFPW